MARTATPEANITNETSRTAVSPILHTCAVHDMITTIARVLGTLFALDRLVKFVAVVHFFRREPPPDPVRWPSVTLLQPITRGTADLVGALDARGQLDYPASIQYLFICDAADQESQTVCQSWLATHPESAGELILVTDARLKVATKVSKLQAALPKAHGEVFCFVDDDVVLRPDALRTLLRHLLQPDVGAVFGLACYTNWRTVPSSLMSLFVNANALLSYIPLTYLTEPFTITGHCFALKRELFAQIGGLDRMDGRIDDDHELARRCQRAGLHLVQTPLVYDVNNDLDSLGAYVVQMRRWFIFPKQAMLPMMSKRNQVLLLLASVGNLIPGLLGLLALVVRRPTARHAFGLSLGLSSAIYFLCERYYLMKQTPLRSLLLLPVVVTLTPFQAVWALWRGDTVTWRGQRLRVYQGGRTESAE